MHQVSVAFIGRAVRFSPNSVSKDETILSAVRGQLLQRGYNCSDVINEDILTALPEVDVVNEDILVELPEADVYVTMGRAEKTLELLRQRQAVAGARVVNGVEAVEWALHRKRLMSHLAAQGIAVAPSTGSDGYWVKRADGSSQSPADVVYAATQQAAELAVRRLQEQGHEAYVSAHVVGDLVKCYGVRGTAFFRYYYPGDDGDWKFGDEQFNGRPRHYAFDPAVVQRQLDAAAASVQLDVYGVDCIIQPDGSAVLIDLNDWPSFSRCCEEAAEAIAQRIIQIA